MVAGDELDEALWAAITCCILAAAGPQRSRVLANLYKDARSSRLPVYGFLEKVYLERILRPEEACSLLLLWRCMSKAMCCVYAGATRLHAHLYSL